MNQALPQNLWDFIWHFLKGYKRFVIPFSILAMITGFWSPINSQLIKYMIDTLNAVDLKENPYLIFWPSVFFVINFEIHNLCWRGMGFLNYRFQPRIKNKIIKETFNYIHSHPHHYFQDNMAGRIANQIEKLADNIERIVHDTIRHLIRAVVLLFVAFASTYLVHPIFFYSIFIWFIIFAGVNIRLSKRFVDLSVLHAMSEANLSGNVVDSITNASNVRIFARRQFEVSFVKDKLRATKAAFRTKEKFALKLQLFQGFSVTAMLSVMLYFLTQLRIKELVTIGDFALILGLSLEVSFVVWWALEQIDELNKSIGKCKQSLKSLLVPLNVRDKEDALELKVNKGEIRFDNVKFHYHGSKSLFENLSVNIKAGEKVGLVGYSGSGKTTFINLILRIYDVNKGQILIDNQLIENCTQDSLRNSISFIAQEPSLFHRTVRDNIRYGRLDATEEEIIESAKRAHVHEFITKIPEGYDLHVGERGIKLSGGQRQRVAIARAILKDAPILIMDEATSALDSVTEHLIQESLTELMQDKTTLVVAHRLSTLLNMDRILVFSEGKIVQDGSHAELLEQEGLYKTLWVAQVGGFLPEKKD